MLHLLLKPMKESAITRDNLVERPAPGECIPNYVFVVPLSKKTKIKEYHRSWGLCGWLQDENVIGTVEDDDMEMSWTMLGGPSLCANRVIVRSQ